MNSVSRQYDSRFEADSHGESIYSRSFGPYKTSAVHALKIVLELRQALAESYPDLFDFSRETLIDDRKIAERLKAMQLSDNIPTPAEAYTYIIKQVFNRRIRRFKWEKGEVVLNLLDFGCGPGRYLEFYISLARVLDGFGIALSVCFNDINAKALEGIRINAEQNFSFVRDSGDQELFVRKNLSFKTVHTNESSSLHTAKILIATEMRKESEWGRRRITTTGLGLRDIFDVSIAIYGVFSNIWTGEMRQPALKFLHDITRTAAVIDSTTPKFLDTFAEGTEMSKLLQILEIDRESGVVTYSCQGSSKLHYALFGAPDAKGRIITNDIDAEIIQAVHPDPTLNGTSFSFVTTVPQMGSHSFDEWQSDFSAYVAARFNRELDDYRKIAEYGMVTMYPHKARHFERNFGHTSR